MATELDVEIAAVGESAPEPESESLAPPVRPRCPYCSEELDGNLAETVVVARRDDGTNTNVNVVYCTACGISLGAVRSERS